MMSPADCQSTAEILPFRRPRTPEHRLATEHRLTTADRIEALRWVATSAAEAGARLAIYRVDGIDADESGDYISIYRANDEWAAWGAARRGDYISVWRSATGADFGRFPTMAEALAAVTTAFFTGTPSFTGVPGF